VETTPVGDDVLLLMTALVGHYQQRVRARLADEGFGDLRDSHGYVFQHLIPGPKTIGALADALGLTQQAASKAVIELERMGYVRRVDGAPDRRVRTVELTDRGAAAILVGRQARAAIDAEVRERAGDALSTALRQLAENTGAYERMNSRRLRPPR
jgi:DNA-binding MarR family transcriptional regulator